MAARQPGLEEVTTNAQPFSVKGKTAIVTGAGSGINYCFASQLLERGCNVLIADLGLRPEAQELVEKYQSRPRAAFQRTDVRKWTQLERMFEAAHEEFGGVDIVCPGAGIFDPDFSNFWYPPGTEKSGDAPDGDRYASIDINITHPIRTAQIAMREFLNPKQGARVSTQNPKRILIISSIAGQNSNLSAAIYVAAKHAMSGFVRSMGTLDAEVGIRVNGVAPGVVKTPLWTESADNMTLLDSHKDVWATPEEVAEAMVRLLEDPELGGGTILEVGHKQTRLVQQFNDPGPSGAGHTVSNMHESYKEAYARLKQAGWGTPKARL